MSARALQNTTLNKTLEIRSDTVLNYRLHCPTKNVKELLTAKMIKFSDEIEFHVIPRIHYSRKPGEILKSLSIDTLSEQRNHDFLSFLKIYICIYILKNTRFNS